jgi:hypothetical protein
MAPLLLTLLLCAEVATTGQLVDDGITCDTNSCHLTGATWHAWNVTTCVDPLYEIEEVDSKVVGAFITAGEAFERDKNYTVILLYLPYCHFSSQMGATLAAIAVTHLCLFLSIQSLTHF